jgi:hypothetical protein
MIRFLMVRVIFTICNTPLESSIILLVQGQADVTDVTAIRFFSASLLDLGEFLQKSDALRKLGKFC